MTSFHLSVRSFRALLALTLLAACQCGSQRTTRLDVEPGTAELRTGQRVRLDARVALFVSEDAELPSSATATFTKSDDRVAFAESMTATPLPDARYVLTLSCTLTSRGTVVCEASVFVVRTGGSTAVTETVEIEALSSFGGSDTVRIVLPGEGAVADGGGDDAGRDAGDGTDGPCDDFRCVNGTLRTEDGCTCVCDDGFSGVACDQSTPTVATLVGALDAGGTAEAGFEDGLGSVARLDTPVGVAVAPDGRVFVADQGNDALRVYDPAAGTLATVLATGLEHPQGVAVRDASTVYVGLGALPRDSALVVVDLSGPTPVATPLPFDGFSGAGPIRDLTFVGGALWVADASSVHRIDVGGGEGNASFALPGASVTAVGAGPEGRLYVTEDGSNAGPGQDGRVIERGAVYLLDPAGPEPFEALFGYQFRGMPITAESGQPALVGRLAGPADVLLRSDGSLLVLERLANRLRSVAPGAGGRFIASHLAGQDGTAFFGTDGAGFADPAGTVLGDAARFSAPLSLAATADGNTVYVADSRNHALRRVDL